MSKIYDLSVSLRPDNMENSDLNVFSITHEEAARIFAKRCQVKVSDLPQTSFFATEQIELRSHVGTHLDAPYHFYPTSEGHPSKFIHEVPLQWCIGDGVILDFRHKKPPDSITEHDIAEELDRISHTLKQDDIVALWTGGTDHYDDDPQFAEAATGMASSALNYLFRCGVKVVAIDSATIDLPIPLMTERLLKGDKSAYFPIHRAGRLTEWTHAEKLTNFESLPGSSGYKFILLPIKILRGTGAWIRAVAIEDEWLMNGSYRLIDLTLPIMNYSFESEESRIVTIHHDQNQRAKAKRLRRLVHEIVHLGSMDIVSTNTHAGTHVVAPYHFGPTVNGAPAQTLDEIPLDWFYGDGVLLDFSMEKRIGEAISVADLKGKLERIDYRLKNHDIVLIRSGADEHFADNPNFPDLAIRLERAALFWLLDQGVRVVGSDSESLDGPVAPMVEALRTGKKDQFFPIHYAGREREFCLIHKMDLHSLSCTHGFKVAAFPIKLERCGAAWTRAVAIVKS